MSICKNEKPAVFEAFWPKKPDLGESFRCLEHGNYCAVAGLSNNPNWEHFAALGLIGNSQPSIAGLEKINSPQSRFYLGASLWIEGNDAEAIEILEACPLPEATRLKNIIKKPQINVLAMSVWDKSVFSDPKFNIYNTGVPRTKYDDDGRTDENTIKIDEPFLKIKKLTPFKPDFFLGHMIEWQYLPYDLNDLACPTFGTTSDLDLHIHNNHTWLPRFDEIITVGSEEWAKANSLRTGPTSTFPKLFGIDPNKIIKPGSLIRDVDLFISGSLTNSYHPDKASLTQELLADNSLYIRCIDGFLNQTSYFIELARAKTTFTYVRHPGSMPSRGIESLASGCAVLTQPESALRLFFGEEHGVYPYEKGELIKSAQLIKDNWESIESSVKRGSELARKEFTQEKCVSQFLRFLSVKTALMGEARPRQIINPPHQKRVIGKRGWGYHQFVNWRMLEHTVGEANEKEQNTPSPHNAINAAREIDLFLDNDVPDFKKGPKAEKVLSKLESSIENIFQEGINNHPNSLTLLFNFIRHNLHHGKAEQINPTLKLIEKILSMDKSALTVDPTEDIMPWDYHDQFFNYRAYLDHATEYLGKKNRDKDIFTDLIRASLAHYIGLYTGEIEWLKKAVQWDSHFPYYAHSLAEALVKRGTEKDVTEATELLKSLFYKSILIIPSFELLSRIRCKAPEIIQDWVDIENRYKKFLRMIHQMGPVPELDTASLVLPSGSSQIPIEPPIKNQNKQLEIKSNHEIKRPKNILMISFECGQWKDARAWSYNGFYAFLDTLDTQNIKHLTLPAIGGIPSNHKASVLSRAAEITKDLSFDQVWIWVTHNDYDPEFLSWLKKIAPVRVGVVMESMEHSEEEEKTFSKLSGRKQKVLSHLEYCTHVLTFDEADASTFTKELPIKAMWCPPVVCWRDVCKNIDLPEPKEAGFFGTCYSAERRKFLEHPSLKESLSHLTPLEETTTLPLEFDEYLTTYLQKVVSKDKVHAGFIIDFGKHIRRCRRHLNDIWQKSLRNSYIQVNLPSIFKSYAGRVVESMAAGRPVISWKPPRKRSQHLFVPGEEILWFDRDNPEQLANHIKFLQENPKEACRIAENARQKILKHHTAEVRMQQVLDWIEFGTEPDYGENTILNKTEKKPNNIMSEHTATLPAELDTLLREADACNDRGDLNGSINALEQALALTNRHPVILRALGTQLFLSKRYTWARTIFEEFTSACPEDATGHVQYAIVVFHEGDADGCAASLQKALVLDPEYTDALKLTADLDVREGSYQEARDKYEKIAEIKGITVEALHALAFCQFQTGDTKRAKDTYKQLLEFNDQDDLARDNLEALTNNPELKPASQNNIDEKSSLQDEDHGSETLEQADFFMQAGNPQAACAELEKAVLKDPKNPRLVESLGSIQFGIEAYEKARLQFRSLIELEPRNPMAYTRLAMTCYELKRISEFESALGLAMEIDPELPELLHFLGKINLEAENYHDAGRCFSKLVELDPTNTQNILALGACLYQGKEYETASLAFERVLEIDPENSTAQKNLDKIRGNKTETDIPEIQKVQLSANELSSEEVIEAFEKALSENDGTKAINIIQDALTKTPNDPELLNVMGNLHLSQDNLTQAAECFHLKANAEEGNVESQLQAAMVYLANGNANQFEVYMEKALHLDPTNPTGLKLLATANFKSENYQEAARLFIQAAAVFPEDVEMLLAMGVCFHHLEDKETAAACFKQALEVDPYNQIASENLLVLENEQPEQPDSPNEDNLAPAIKAGSLKEAQKLLSKEQYLDAWNASIEAINQRPFHPDAYLLLAEIALSAGDEVKAKSCLEDLTQLTPKWPIAIETLDSLRTQSNLKAPDIEWPAAPPVNQNRLSVCMIVKDEEQFIGQCLESVKSIANQIVVVDTGSTDQTEAIAKSHGAEVHHFEWCDDFAAARNFALEHVRGDWILILDADEVLTQKGREGLNQDTETQNVLGHRIRCEHLEPNESGGYKLMADAWHYIPRLVRNAPGLHFTGIIHEEIFSSAVVRMQDWGMEISFGQTQINHYGYAPVIKKDRNKIERNITLLERALKDQPDCPHILISYALDLYNRGDIEVAIEKTREAFKLLAKHSSNAVAPEVRERLISVFCNLLLQSELYDEVIEVGESQLAKDCGPTASILYMHALALVKTGKIEKAIKALRECLSKEHEGSYCAQFFGGAHGGFTTVHNLLADCLAKTDRHNEALSEYKLAVEAEPLNTSIRYGYARFLSNIGQPEEAIQALHQAIKNGSIDCSLWSLGSQIVNAQMSDSEIAMHWTQCAVEECCNHPEAQKQRGVALLTVGRFEEALSFFEKAPQNTVTEAAKILCQLILNKATTSVDIDKETEISTAFINWYRRLLEYGNESAIKSINDKASSLNNILPTANQILIEALLEK